MAYARKNVTRNNLTGRIKLIATHSDASLIPLDALSLSKIDFLMCNPPFYSSQDELLSLAAQKSRPPFSVRLCTSFYIAPALLAISDPTRHALDPPVR